MSTCAHDICRLSASELRSLLTRGELSSFEITQAFIDRIERVNPQLNALIEPRYDLALKEAKDIDQRRMQGEEIGQLAGLPITIKASYALDHWPANDGIQPTSKLPPSEEAQIVQQLKAAGGIPLGRTNVGQLLAMFETDNPIFGRTRNPWNLSRSAGGSSGGEAALVATCASPIGLGSDGGGSVRHPAHVCGIYGFKPTSNRFDMRGHVPTPNYPPGAFQGGPLARHVDDLQLLLSAASSHKLKTSTSPQVRWTHYRRAQVDQLRIGYVEDDGFFTPAPAIRRALREAVSILVGDGIEVVPFQVPNIEEAMSLFFGLFHADGFRRFSSRLSGHAKDWRIARMLRHGQTPTIMRPWLIRLFTWFGHTKLARAMTFANKKPLSVEDYWKLLEAREDYIHRYIQAMRTSNVDIILSPPYGLPAFLPQNGPYLWQAGSYALLNNLLGFPAGVVPVTLIRADEQTDRTTSKDMLQSLIIHTEKESQGLPVGVQVAGFPWQDHQVLAVMKRLESHLQLRDDYPCHSSQAFEFASVS